MKLSLNPKETRRLLMMLYLVDHVLNDLNDSPPTGFRLKCAELLDKLMGHAWESGCADLLEEDEEGRLSLSDSIEEEPGVLDAMIDHENAFFWQELVSRLAERDYELHKGKPAIPENAKEIDDLSPEEWDELQEELEHFESSYWTEFEKHGVRHLHLMRGTGHPS
ncbi:MAG TPA: hypothetical protein VIK52_10650 [Opitutaceae bacterium]